MKCWLQSGLLLLSAVAVSARVPRATLDITPGAHQLLARATHPSGHLVTTTSSFTNTAQNEVSIDQFGGAGFLASRTRIANGQPNGIQTLSWDGRGRLWKVTERDSLQNGYDW